MYTTLGGIKAVIWTDFIQASIMMGSAVAAMVLLYLAIPGGWSGVSARNCLPRTRWTCSSPAASTRSCTAGRRIKGMFETEYTVFAIIGSTFVTMGTHGTDQDMVQRMLTAPDIRRSRRSLILSGLADIPISLVVFLTIGVLLFAYYQARPDAGKPEATNELFCYYILHQLPVGMRGLLLAGILPRRWVR